MRRDCQEANDTACGRGTAPQQTTPGFLSYSKTDSAALLKFCMSPVGIPGNSPFCTTPRKDICCYLQGICPKNVRRPLAFPPPLWYT